MAVCASVAQRQNLTLYLHRGPAVRGAHAWSSPGPPLTACVTVVQGEVQTCYRLSRAGPTGDVPGVRVDCGEAAVLDEGGDLWGVQLALPFVGMALVQVRRVVMPPLFMRPPAQRVQCHASVKETTRKKNSFFCAAARAHWPDTYPRHSARAGAPSPGRVER